MIWDEQLGGCFSCSKTLMFTRRTHPIGRSEAHKNNLWNWQSQGTRSDALRGRCETVFCLSAAVLARPWPVAGANQMFDVRVLCFLMSHSGQQGVVAEGSSARSLQFVSASGDTQHTATETEVILIWLCYVVSVASGIKLLLLTLKWKVLLG